MRRASKPLTDALGEDMEGGTVMIEISATRENISVDAMVGRHAGLEF